MDENLATIAEEFAKIRFFLGAFFVLLYFAVVVVTVYFAVMTPVASLAWILVMLELLFGLVLIVQYATMVEKLRKRRPKKEKKTE